ncbi:hypothetical protein ZOSMA_45G00060 [Zostera marina]|uniref:Uncharacterized protein n=1 Tax=Zostera marina TaxID=29655 RepID=A0A0K9P0G0_ZOSMR|nr:hypothetical protein ZOSMA_45G00060 [Zostera marina]
MKSFSTVGDRRERLYGGTSVSSW